MTAVVARGWRPGESIVLDVAEGDSAAGDVCSGELPPGAAYRIEHVTGTRSTYAFGCLRPHALRIVADEVGGIERAARGL